MCNLKIWKLYWERSILKMTVRFWEYDIHFYILDKYKDFCEMFRGQYFLLCPGLLYIHHPIQFQSTSRSGETWSYFDESFPQLERTHTVYLRLVVNIFFCIEGILKVNTTNNNKLSSQRPQTQIFFNVHLRLGIYWQGRSKNTKRPTHLSWIETLLWA